ncbi:MAG: EamA family transporter [Zymomonas mobilis subsp. pomaceae]|uniref:EamA domain-containing protein n=1 Tax=Zymomonas mobilis subsp. pomaceae (strain ATCC 29192 / DSM 22645 / JCM 10191 / CCUG 17912 / NBRC 13757 / NCIMB 11200 / NRRL B-4491 / Barker I) TaxID=579138 RepID=F8ESU9_ZYMMT|nr:EamA family transporter [Zymomonas mobilis]AEI36915.1 protein of unknown function DUF6 transmembrane [Zymomonas mobilis subsp. pomaceae ATCC 29192]MDX5948288.1 EamA family transporter [Zymomonas mobilis subsp. pomaceae]GEB89042.1 membrane protein [Zymomonas mobilis subsp. pomaceae]
MALTESEVQSNNNLRLTSPKVLIAFLLVTLIWSTTWFIIRGQLNTVPANWSVCYRFFIAGLMMFLFCRAKGYKITLDRGNQLFCMVSGLLLITASYGFVYAAESHITSGLVAVAFALVIIPNSFFARVFLGKKSSPYFVLGSALAGIGLGLLFRNQLGHFSSDTETRLGLGLSLLGVLSASLGEVLLATPRGRSHPMPVFLAWSMIWGSIGIGVVALFIDGAPVFDTSLPYLESLLYLTVFGSVLAFIFYFYVLQAVGPAMSAYSHVLIPIVAMGISTLFENYIWGISAIAGSGMVLLGLLLTLKSQQPNTPIPLETMIVD